MIGMEIVCGIIGILLLLLDIGIVVLGYLNNKQQKHWYIIPIFLGVIALMISSLSIQSITWGIIPLTIIIAAIIGGISVWGCDSDLAVFLSFFSAISVVSTIICLIITWASYNSYMEVTNFKTTKYQQYIDTVNTYEKLISKNRGDGNELTDLQFQGFQQSLAKMIESLRTEVVTFNETVADKRILVNNKLIGFLIFPPGPEVEILPLMNE